MEYESGLDRILEFVKYDVGDANCVRFWHDKWCGENSLKEPYMELYTITIDKEASVHFGLEGQ